MKTILCARINLLGGLACLVLATCGCNSFQQQWTKMAADSPPPHEIVGRWQGTWSSDPSGHTGPLRCILTKVGETGYQARYHAGYFKILTADYTVSMEVEQEDDGWEFSGETNLGWLMGVYRHQGQIRGEHYRAEYTSKHDHGVMDMRKVE